MIPDVVLLGRPRLLQGRVHRTEAVNGGRDLGEARRADGLGGLHGMTVPDHVLGIGDPAGETGAWLVLVGGLAEGIRRVGLVFDPDLLLVAIHRRPLDDLSLVGQTPNLVHVDLHIAQLFEIPAGHGEVAVLVGVEEFFEPAGTATVDVERVHVHPTPVNAPHAAGSLPADGHDDEALRADAVHDEGRLGMEDDLLGKERRDVRLKLVAQDIHRDAGGQKIGLLVGAQRVAGGVLTAHHHGLLATDQGPQFVQEPRRMMLQAEHGESWQVNVRSDLRELLHGPHAGRVDDGELLPNLLFGVTVVAHVAVKQERDIDLFHPFLSIRGRGRARSGAKAHNTLPLHGLGRKPKLRPRPP